jgi:drug/metabolite transporter (DMT)-like permease
MLIGILAALGAAFAWSLNFIVPFVIGPYSVFDFSLIRFLVAGSACAVFLLSRRRTVSSLTSRDWLITLFLGLIGYLGYFLALVGAAIYAGPVLAPAILGLVPVVLGIAGNMQEKTVPWRKLVMPLGLAALGLLLIHHHPVSDPAIRSVPIGVALALTAVGLWTWFGLVNQNTLARRPTMDAGVWTALITLGASVGFLCFIPVGWYFGLFNLPTIGLGWEHAAPLYIWGVVLALCASLGAAWAWTIAAQRLPVALAAQLIVMEAVFGTVVGLLVHRRWPSAEELTGMTVLIVGVIAAVRAFDSENVGLRAARRPVAE